MKRRNFLNHLAGGAVIGTVAAADRALAKPSPTVPPLDGPLFTTPVSMLAPRADGVELACGITRLARGWAEWKTADGASGRAAEDGHGFVPQGDRMLRVRIDGLQPGTEYAVRLVAEAGDGEAARQESPWRAFRPLDPAAATTRFCVWNDTHQWLDTIRKLDEVTPACDFLIWNGDTCNDWHQEEWLTPTLLHPGGRDVTAQRPLLLVWGNHDVRGKWAFGVRDRIPSPGHKPYCAFRSGPVAVICLHTGEDKPDNHPSFGGRVAFEALRQEQAAWLTTATSRPEIRDAPYRIVFCHIPLRWTKEGPPPDYAKGGYDHFARACRDAWHEPLVKWRAQLVVSGHTHRPALLPGTENFPYAQLVGGGPQPDAATFITGTADMNRLNLTCTNLDGKVLHEVALQPLG